MYLYTYPASIPDRLVNKAVFNALDRVFLTIDDLYVRVTPGMALNVQAPYTAIKKAFKEEFLKVLCIKIDMQTITIHYPVYRSLKGIPTEFIKRNWKLL
jgi:hypothetical protein